jgi:hypothetical protein
MMAESCTKAGKEKEKSRKYGKGEKYIRIEKRR